MEWKQFAVRPLSRGARAALYAALVVALYTALVGWALPWWLRQQLPGWCEQAIGQPLAIGELRIDPWALRLQARGLALGEQPWVRIGALAVDVDPWRSLSRQRLLVASVAVEAPWVSLVREADGRLRLPALPPRAAESEPPAGKPFPLELERLSIDAGALDYREPWRGGEYARRVEGIRLDAAHLSTLSGESGLLSLALGTPEGERLALGGRLGLAPAAGLFRLQLSGLDLARLGQRLEGLLPLRLQGGRLDFSASAHLGSGASPQLRLEAGRLAVAGLALADAAGAPLLALESIGLEGLALDLQQRQLQAQRLALVAPALELRRLPSGALDLPARLAAAAPPAPATPAAASAAPWRWQLGRLSVSGGRIGFSDESVRPAFSTGLEALDLQVQDLSGDLSRPLPLELAAAVKSGGRLALKGQLAPAPLNAELAIRLEGLELPPLQPYLDPHIDARLASGRLGLELALRAAAGPSLQLSGRAGLSGFRLLDPKGRDFAVAERLDATGIELSGAPWRLKVALVDAERTYGRFTLYEDRSTNASRMLRRAPPAAGQQAAPRPVRAAGAAKPGGTTSAPAFALQIDRLQVRQGSAYFTDYFIKPRFSTAITDVRGAITGVSNTSPAPAGIHFRGSAGEHAPVALDGHASLFAPDRDLKLALGFRNIELTTFSPYSGTFAGYKIRKGKLNLDLDYRIENRRLVGENRLVVDQFTLGDRVQSRSATSLPVKLAVALLKDSRGVIDLDLPVKGSLDEPEFSVGGLVLKALVALVKKVVAAPFAALGGLLDGGEQALDSVSFAAGSSAVAADQQRKLASLASALQQRPALRLNLQGGAALADLPALQRLWLDEHLARLPAGDPQERLETLYEARSGEGYGALLKRLRAGGKMDRAQARAAGPAEAERLLLEGARIDEDDLHALAQQRARAVQAALVALGLPAERLYLLDTQVQAAGGAAPPGVALTLEAG